MKIDICLICSSQMQPFIRKRFDNYAIRDVSYLKCESCGFVWAKTIAELPEDKWAEVNHGFHSSYQGNESYQNDPQWCQRLDAQASAISLLANAGLIPTSEAWVDFGAGDGKLAALLYQKASYKMHNYEPFMTRDGYLKRDELVPHNYSFVISTSVFEHLRGREQFDEIANLVSANGVMALHTIVVEEVPDSSEWFYFMPVHCAFFTNKAMQSLFEQWEFRASLYLPSARLWFWFKTEPPLMEKLIEVLNRGAINKANSFHYQKGFVDYWKLSPLEAMKRRSLANLVPVQ